MCHSERAHVPRSAGRACAVGSKIVRYAVSRLVLPLIVRVRVIRTACSAFGKPSPPGVLTVSALTVRVSLRP